jgi:IstB-like ATP binding protein/TIR domain-containing protein
VEGVDFTPRLQTFEWQEDVHQQNFQLKARSYTEGRVLRGQLTVYLGAFILADIDLTFRVDNAGQPPPTPTFHLVALRGTSPASPGSPEWGLAPVTADPYQRIFASYSHKDLAIVRQIEGGVKSLGHFYLRDRLALRSGEQWEARLPELIDEADVFQLFWSSNSMRSEYVRREYEHALVLRRPLGFIRPTYWEVPMPRSANPRLPPDALAALHFHGFFDESDGDLDFSLPTARESTNEVEPSPVVMPSRVREAELSETSERRYRWVRAAENVCLIGPAGTGKSHLLRALGSAAVDAGYRVRYLTAAELVDTLYRGLADNSVGKVIDTLLRNDLIICDELGFAPLDDTAAQLLFRVAAYERRSLGIGSHWPFEAWGRFLPEHTTAVSLLDRLLHHCNTVITDGESYRMRQARHRGGTTTRT